MRAESRPCYFGHLKFSVNTTVFHGVHHKNRCQFPRLWPLWPQNQPVLKTLWDLMLAVTGMSQGLRLKPLVSFLQKPLFMPLFDEFFLQNILASLSTLLTVFLITICSAHLFSFSCFSGALKKLEKSPQFFHNLKKSRKNFAHKLLVVKSLGPLLPVQVMLGGDSALVNPALERDALRYCLASSCLCA